MEQKIKMKQMNILFMLVLCTLILSSFAYAVPPWEKDSKNWKGADTTDAVTPVEPVEPAMVNQTIIVEQEDGLN